MLKTSSGTVVWERDYLVYVASSPGFRKQPGDEALFGSFPEQSGVNMAAKFLAVLCAFLAVCATVLGSRPLRRDGPLPRASATPVNVDPKLDCAIKELAWEFAKKLLPRQGSFHSAYDALQLAACNISLASGKRYKPRPFLYQSEVKPNAVEIYVATDGSDNNPGTLDKPVQTLQKAVQIYRQQNTPGQGGVIYVRKGTYYLAATVDLGPVDSNLVITGYQDERPVISGGKEYKFGGIWKEFVNEMGPVMDSVNAISGAVSQAGSSNSQVAFYGKVGSYNECETACEKNTSCFAYTWHDSTTGDFAEMCYFRIDGLWVPAAEKGHYSGKKLRLVMADLKDQNPNKFATLFLNGRRAVRARYPDGNPETMGLHTSPTGYVSAAKTWLPPKTYPPATDILIESPERNGTHFPQFHLGIGGSVVSFDPPESYWGIKDPAGGGGRTYEIVTGLQYSSDEWIANQQWKRPDTGVVHAYHCGHWGNWIFAVDGQDKDKQEITWSYGGFQEARGCSTGAEWYVENIREELDAPGEWYYDDQNYTLFYYPNGTAPMSGVGTVLDQLINIRGTQDNPVYNITIANMTFTQTAPTYFMKYEVPSAGDWSIHRGGTVFVEGVNGFLMQNCIFDAPGGNALYLSNYIRNAVIEGNEFVYTGDSAIAAVGSADLIDGTLGNQPRGTKVIGNLMHEIGIWGKQTSPYFQSVSCETELRGNVLFNGPRAGLNFNDGFGGGNLVTMNLAFNMVRETGDHGPFNSWDRQPYLTKVKNGLTPSLTPAQSNLTRNFFINNYHSTWPIDHDDGSCYYYDTYNYLIYGGYKNFLGHTKIVKYNTYVYPDALHELDLEKAPKAFLSKPYCANSDGASTTDLPSGWGEVWANNTCIIGNPNVYEYGSCTTTGTLTGLIPFTANNSFYAPNKDIYIKCQSDEWSLQDFQKKGYDIGSQVFDPVDTATIVDWGRKLLGL